MKKVLISAAALSMLASATFAGGPVLIVEESEPAVVNKPRSGAFLPIVAGLVILCAVACGSDS